MDPQDFDIASRNSQKLAKLAKVAAISFPVPPQAGNSPDYNVSVYRTADR